MKLSQWHSCKVKPVHIGVYEFTPDPHNKWYRMWDGKSWRFGATKRSVAALETMTLSEVVGEKWRGIVK